MQGRPREVLQTDAMTKGCPLNSHPKTAAQRLTCCTALGVHGCARKCWSYRAATAVVKDLHIVLAKTWRKLTRQAGGRQTGRL